MGAYPESICYSSLLIDAFFRLVQILRAELDAEKKTGKGKIIHVYEWSTSRAIAGTSVGSPTSSNLIFIDSE